MAIRIGTSGWSYDHWEGILYPHQVPQRERLDYYIQHYQTVEVNSTYYRWPKDATFTNWRQQKGAAYCVMSGAHLPCILRATGSFVYVRLHGPDPDHLYGGFYSDDDLHWWAFRLREWEEKGHSVFVYFNNDGGGNAVRNASRLKTFVGAGTS